MEPTLSYQLSDLVTKVQQRARDTGYSPTEIKGYINDAQNAVFNEYTLPFTETVQTYTLTPNVADITNGSGLPANFVQAIDLTLTTVGREKVLRPIDVRQLDYSTPDAEDTTTHPADVPDEWYRYAQTIKVYPVPNDAYTVSLRYNKKATVLSGDSDVPEVPSEFEELLVVGAAYRVIHSL